MADEQQSQTSDVPPTVAEHDGWEVHSASAVDHPKPEEIVERLTDVPGDEQVEQKAKHAAREDKAEDQQEQQDERPATEERRSKASERNLEIKARIAAETKAYHDARRAREFEQSETIRLRQEREALERRASEPKPEKPIWAKYEEQGKSYEDFLDDRAEYDRQQTIQLTRSELEQRERQAYERASRIQQERAVEQHAHAHDTRINKAAEQHEDFHELVQQNLSDIPDTPFLVHVIQHHDQGAEILYHLAQNPDEARVLSKAGISQAVGDAIAMSNTPVELLSHFAQHPQELDRLNQMPPAPALMALGELKARITAANNGSAKSEISNAKPPIKPVGEDALVPAKNPTIFRSGRSGSGKKTNGIGSGRKPARISEVRRIDG